MGWPQRVRPGADGYTPGMTHRLGIIGGGNMGAAIVRGGIAAKVVVASQVIVAEIDPRKREQLKSLGCDVTDDPRAAATAEQFILAVKPQIFPDVVQTIVPLRESKVVISIMAGLHTSKIRQAVGSNARMIRAMPNMPCQIGEGMTAVALGDGASPGDESLAMSLFKAVGKVVLLDESLMHAVTAVSGSGPAYIFALAEAMEEAGLATGLNLDVSRMLVTRTILGAARLLAEGHQTAAALRQSVTSPGGTTAAAIDVFQQRGFGQIIVDALIAARDRGVTLGQ